MELWDNDLKPGGYGNWEDIKKKSSNSDENCESDIENGEKFFFSKLTNSNIVILVPQIYGKWLKKCISGRIWAKLSPEMKKLGVFYV